MKSPHIASISEAIIYIVLSQELHEELHSEPGIPEAFNAQFAQRFKYTFGDVQLGGLKTITFHDNTFMTTCIIQASRLEEFKQWLAEASWKH